MVLLLKVRSNTFTYLTNNVQRRMLIKSRTGMAPDLCKFKAEFEHLV